MTLPSRPSSPLLQVREPGSDQNYGPFINVVTWVLLITSALSVLTRIVTKRALRRHIGIDDILVIAALIVSVGSGIAVTIQTANGLGQDVGSLENAELLVYEKAEYANRMLYLATLALAKLSIISLLMILTASDFHRYLGISLTTLIALWGIVSIFLVALQCRFGDTERLFGPGSSCSSMLSFWQTMGAMNILTDSLLIIFPLHVILTLQMSLAKKLKIVTFFAVRTLDIIATAVQMTYTPEFESSNPTRSLWKWTLTTQVVECITIITSCVPYLRPLLESIPSGMYGADELRRRGTSSEHGYSFRRKSGSYKLSSASSSESKAKSRRSRGEPDKGTRRFLPMLSESEEVTTHSNSATGLPGGPRRHDGAMDVEITAAGGRNERIWETDSIGSQAKIVKTTVVSAQWEEMEAQRRSKETAEDGIEVINYRA